MPKLSPPTKARRKAEALLNMWKEQGLTVGGLIIEGKGEDYKITILTEAAAASEIDPYDQWERQQKSDAA